MIDYKNNVADALMTALPEINDEQAYEMIELPKDSKKGDLAVPMFKMAKIKHNSPVEIAKEVSDQLNQKNDKNFDKIEASGPYVNFFLNRKRDSQVVIKEVLHGKQNYGSSDLGQGKNVPVDLSSPNIAKPMSMGHLRSTVIGNALANILVKNGFNPIKINHLGDWGTQFGKLITGYKLWGSEEEVKADPITNLLKYYVEFHEEAEKNPQLEEDARAWFKKLENGDEEATNLWKWFREESLREFKKIYKLLDISFDSYTGESFYNDKMDEIIDMLEDKNLLEESRGAQIVDLEKYDLNPALIKKSDGATLYLTRDLATAFYRYRTYNFDKSIYVVGAEQENHFKQLKAVLNKMGEPWGEDIIYVPFGLITQGGKKLSTRKGNIILLEDVLDKAVNLAEKQISEKNPDLDNAQEVAKEVGIGAVIFHDLKNERTDSFDFDLKEVVSFVGQTGPYVQYSNARANSLLAKSKVNLNDAEDKELAITDQAGWHIVMALASYPDIVKRSLEELEPSIIAKYALNLSKYFNKYYANSKIIGEPDEIAKLALVKAVSIVLVDSLGLLGVKAPVKM